MSATNRLSARKRTIESPSGTRQTLTWDAENHLQTVKNNLSSNAVTTNSSGSIVGGEVRYRAYGAMRSGNAANLKRARTFTGQKADSTGLMYFNARYYDPSLGQFLSPDTLVPDAGLVLDDNRI
ncbi:MAG: RHS repeat-associated core domain-containing protein [Caldilineaceae bacterium]